MTPKEAKRLVNEWLHKNGFRAKATKAKTVSFEGFGYGSAIFVTVDGWKPNPLAEHLQLFAKNNGLRITFKGCF